MGYQLVTEDMLNQVPSLCVVVFFGVCGCPNIFAAILLYGMLATLFMVVFICFSTSSGHDLNKFNSQHKFTFRPKPAWNWTGAPNQEVSGTRPGLAPSTIVRYERDKDPFKAKNFYRRKTKEDIGLYEPKQTGEHLGELKRRLADLRDDFRDVKDLKKKYYSHCKTCSLVTSSGRLLFHQAGEEIDSAECVIRMNNAPVVGYEEYVGKKTTTRIVCFRSVANLRKSMLAGKGHTDEVVVWGAENPSHGRWAMSKLKLLMKQYSQTKWFSLKDVGEEKVNVIFESETGISRAKSHTWLSTGLFTMLFALQTCDNITVYGMVDENYCRMNEDIEAPYHYWEDLPWNECEFLNMHEKEKKQGHRYLTEKALFRRFASMFNLRFSYPEWSLTNESQIDINSPFREKYMKEHHQR